MRWRGTGGRGGVSQLRVAGGEERKKKDAIELEVERMRKMNNKWVVRPIT
jgi:hypothetical protein